MDVAEEELHGLYQWVDSIPLSRPKRNIARDFSDAVLVAEMIHHYLPKLIELHNYSQANGITQKMYNWQTLNNKVFKKLGFVVAKNECEQAAKGAPGAIERILKLLKLKVARSRSKHSAGSLAEAPASANGDSGGARGPPVSAAPKANKLEIHRAGVPEREREGPRYLGDKDETIAELQETNEILETKVRKLEQLVRLKDAKIQALSAKLQGAGLGP